MAGIEGLAGDIATQTLDESLKNFGKQSVIRTVQTAAKVSGYRPPGPQDDYGLAKVDFEVDRSLRSQQFQAHLYAPRQYREAPELFFGPLPQVGTYLRESGVLKDSAFDNFGTQIALDILFDPTSYLGGGLYGAGKAVGLSGLTKAGKAARITTELLQGGVKGKTGEALVHAVADTLEAAGKVAGVSDEIAAAAKAGDKAAISLLAKKALASGELPAEYKVAVESLRRDAKGIAGVIQNAEKITAHGPLTEADFLQDTLRGRLKFGQTLGPQFVISDNPFKHPLAFTRQVAGFTHEGDRFFFPAADGIAHGLDKIGVGKFLQPKGTVTLVEELSAKVGFAVDDAAKSAYRAAPDEVNRLKAYQTVAAHEVLLAVNSAPTQRLYSLLETGNLNDDLVQGLYRRVSGISDKTDIDPAALATFREKVLVDVNGARAALDKSVLERQHGVLEQMTARIDDLVGQASRNGKLDQVQAESLKAQNRRGFSTLRTAGGMLTGAESIGDAFAGRVSVGNLLGHVVGTSYTDVIRGAYKGAGAREMIHEITKHVIEHPEFFRYEEKAGQYFLTHGLDAIGDEAPFLKQTLKTSRASKHTAFLEEHLLTEGLNPEVSQVVRQMIEGYTATGANLVHEGVIRGTIANYVTRRFIPGEKFFKEFKVLHRDVGDHIAGLFLGETQNDKLAGFLAAPETREFVKRAKQGVVPFAEQRKFTESFVKRLVDLGYGTVEGDGVGLYAAYMADANRALIWNRVVQNPKEVSLLLARERIVAELGEEAAKGITNEFLTKHGIHSIMLDGEFPAEARHLIGPLFTRVTTREVPTELGLDVAALTERAAGRVGNADDIRGGLAAELHGKAEVGGVKLVDKHTGKPIPFQDEWVLTNSYPRDLKQWSEVKAAVGKILKEREAALAGEAAGSVARVAAAREERTARSLLVFKPDHGHFQEAFRLYDKSGVNNAFTRALDKWNYRLKSVKLAGDVFHYNVLALSQFALNPLDVLTHLKDEAGGLLPGVREGAFAAPVLTKAAVGAVVGGGIAAVSDRDAPDIATFSLAGAIYGAALGAAKKNALSGFNMLLSPESADTLLWMGLGGWSGRPDDRATGVIQSTLKGMYEALAHDPVKNGALLSPISGLRHVMNWFDHQLWGILQNGSKHYYFANRWEKYLPKLTASTFAISDSVARSIGADAHALDSVVHTLPSGLRITDQVSRTGASVPIAFYDGRPFIHVIDGDGRGAWLYQSMAGTGGKVQGNWFAVGGVVEDASGRGWIVKGDVANDPGYGRKALASLERQANAVLPHGDDDTRAFIDSLTGRSDGWATDLNPDYQKKIAKTLERGKSIADSATKGDVLNAWKNARLNAVWGPRGGSPPPLPSMRSSGRTISFKDLPIERQHALKLDLAKQLVQASNNVFGGQTWRFILEKPEVRHSLGYVFLSPDWTTSRIQQAAAIFMNLKTPERVALGAAIGTATDLVQYGDDIQEGHGRGPVYGAGLGLALGAFAQNTVKRMATKGDVLAAEARRLAAAQVGLGLLAMEGLNLALSGHLMHENPEGKKTSVDLGDGTYLHMGKSLTEPLEFAGIYEPDKYPIPIISRAVSKGSAAGLTTLRILSNDNGYGEIITGADSPVTTFGKSAHFLVDATLPIFLSGPTRAAGEFVGDRANPGTLQRALLRTAGFSTNTIPRVGYTGPQRSLNIAPPSVVQLPQLGNPGNLLTANRNL